ncbi:ABC transporter permease [Acidiluteibacter ferrifornacis]|uniref:FtsX-like permease family protein n=1 Tax=Acidiluteibacter ferrifornacis TaxID=2692424 RepID=A0A6N9NKA1_9FLAO|nr:ABC transporter permease [Acidiluteibacter ferrifornacis]NBG67128.1 FtsX-like permease family protein [Acidiluteibacter ferrifornacis]
MFDSDKWQEIYSSLRKNTLRTIMTAFGVSWGIFMLVVMLGAGKGLENGIISGFGGTVTNSVFIWTQSTSVPYAGLPKGRRFNMNNEDMEAIQHGVSEIEYLAPRNQLRGYNGGNNVSFKTKSGNFSVMGDYPEIQFISPMEILEGRFINQLDIEEKRKVVVIGTNVKEVLFGDKSPINENVKINGVYFKVVGVWKTKKSGNQAEKDTKTLFVPFSTFQKAFNYGNIVGWMAVTAQPNSSGEAVEKKIVDILKKRHKVAPQDERAFGSFNAEKEFKQMSGLFGAISTLIWVVGIGTLMAGVIGVTNIMLIVIKERTKEIGIRRAIGATPASIISQIMMESIVLTGLAGYFGLVGGIGVIELIAANLGPADGDSMFTNPEIDLQVALTALVILIISGALAGLIPARKAVKIKPIEALRTE